jgi:hypothetical protein
MCDLLKAGATMRVEAQNISARKRGAKAGFDLFGLTFALS